MNEYSEIESFVKARLEEGVPREVPCIDRILEVAAAESFARTAEARSRRRLWAATLAAASLAAVCLFPMVRLATAPKPESTVACVIDLLRTADGVESSEETESTVAEMLLAWQDAPYESAIADLVAAN